MGTTTSIITYVGVGTAGAGTISLTPTVSALSLVGDILICTVVNKYPTNGPATPTGGGPTAWRLIGQASGGAGAAGIDSGTVYATMFWKVCETDDISATMTIGITSGNSGTSRIYTLRPSGQGLRWDDPIMVSGAVNSAGTAWSATTGPMDVMIDDTLFCFSAINGNTYSYTSQAVTSPDAEPGGFSTFPNDLRTDAGTAQGDDCGVVVTTHNVIVGGNSKPLVYSMTASGTAGSEPAGVTAICRLRELGTYAVMRPVRRARTLILKRRQKSPQEARRSIAEEVERMRRMQR